MTQEEYLSYDGLGLAQLVKTKQVKAIELVEQAIQRAETVNPSINAIIHPLYDMAKMMAETADPDSLFAGVPYLFKDLEIHIAGVPMRSGCRGYQHFISDVDSHITTSCRKAGLSFLGRTNTPEFGLTPFTEPLLFGPTRNPWNLQKTTGGSSGGSAAAVAAGIVPIASASDGGGSIRIPASCCGLFGLKPSRGRVSVGPVYGEVWGGAVVEHCVSKSVRDSAALLDATSPPFPGELYLHSAPEKPYVDVIQEKPGKLRIGFGAQHPLGLPVEKPCLDALDHTVQLLESLGHEVEAIQLPYERADIQEVFLTMTLGETAATIKQLELFLGRSVKSEEIEPSTWALKMMGDKLSARDFAWQKWRWNDIARRMGDFHQKYDLLLSPTLAKAPFDIGTLQPSKAEESLLAWVKTFGLSSLLKARLPELAEKIFGFIPFTLFANMTGQPSMSVPLFWSEDGLPIGTMFTAALGREDLLFRLAAQLEEAQPWAHRLPVFAG
ncbi:MAG TPA: amidase family protein [Saprospiraceae bacterium]|nr:amidase family protein [Saprospiraceae bacterium]HMQ84310.1 amidase family protein [Saprospiraceae bacterium]